LSPLEIFAKAFPTIDVTPDELTVISWILPQTNRTKSEHRNQIEFPTERWARARIYGEEFNDKLRWLVVTTLLKSGIKATSPILSPLYESKKSPRYSLSSTWSERHAAYAAGLGTFGLCDGLITQKGKAIRCGSVVARIRIKPSERVYSDHHQYCLFYAEGICGKCMKRCPAGAISEIGHDKLKCSAYLENTRQYVKTKFGFEGYGCGLCQTRVPCESGIPNAFFRK
jgi:epoxyqueuosine reductase